MAKFCIFQILNFIKMYRMLPCYYIVTASIPQLLCISAFLMLWHHCQGPFLLLTSLFYLILPLSTSPCGCGCPKFFSSVLVTFTLPSIFITDSELVLYLLYLSIHLNKHLITFLNFVVTYSSLICLISFFKRAFCSPYVMLIPSYLIHHRLSYYFP